MGKSKTEKAKLSVEFINSLEENARGLLSRVGVLALNELSPNPLYPDRAYQDMVLMYNNLKAMLEILSVAADEKNLSEDKASYLLDVPTFIKITEVSAITMEVYDSLQSSYGINLTLH